MTTTTKISYDTSTSITITAGSLTTGSARESASIDNTSTLYDDVMVHVEATLASGTPSSGYSIYAAGSEDGTNWTDNATGSDAALTMRSPTNLKLLGTVFTSASGGLNWKSSPMGIAKAFDGIMPREWSIVVVNNTSLSFTAFTAKYTGIWYTQS